MEYAPVLAQDALKDVLTLSSMTATIDLDALTGDMAGEIGRQIHHEIGHFSRLSISAVRDGCRTLFT